MPDKTIVDNERTGTRNQPESVEFAPQLFRIKEIIPPHFIFL
ncbi:MAG: hypothetical protein U0U70_16555 [Chitinophagaceae bacterium]